MSARRFIAPAVLPLLLFAAGCTGADDGSPAAQSTPAASSAAAPTPAGPAEASALAPLPTGPATGDVVLTWSGLGEIREPFTGQCSHDGATTRLEGSADTAQIQVTVTPDGASVAVEDVGLSTTSELATGRYDVSGGHLALAAPLASGGQAVGSIELEVDCGP